MWKSLKPTVTTDLISGIQLKTYSKKKKKKKTTDLEMSEQEEQKGC